MGESGAHALSPTTVMQLPELLAQRVQRDPELAPHFAGGGGGGLGVQNEMLKAVLAQYCLDERAGAHAGGHGSAMADEAVRIDDFREQEMRAGLSPDDVERWGDLLLDSLREAGVDASECRNVRRTLRHVIDQAAWRDHLDLAIRALEEGEQEGKPLDRAAVIAHLLEVRRHLSPLHHCAAGSGGGGGVGHSRGSSESERSVGVGVGVGVSVGGVGGGGGH